MHYLLPLVALLAPSAMAKPFEGPLTKIAADVPATTPTVDVVTVTIPDGFVPPTPTGNATSDNNPEGMVFPGIYCSYRDMPDDGYESINAAIAYMDQECSKVRTKVPARQGLIYRSKNAQVYFCNYANADVEWELFCEKRHYDFAAQGIDKYCTVGAGGWLYTDAILTNHPWSVGRDPRYDENGIEISECGF